MDIENFDTDINENKNRIYDESDLKRANSVIKNFRTQVEKVASVRFSASRAEKDAALKSREVFYRTLNNYSRMEPFTVRPLSGRYGIPILGIIYSISLLFYIIGISVFSGGGKVCLMFSMLFNTLMIALYIYQIYLNKNVFSIFYPKQTSYNVVSDIEPVSGDTDFTFILSSHYDSNINKVDFSKFLKLNNMPDWLILTLKIIVYFSVFCLFIFSYVGYWLTNISVGVKVLFLVFPVILSLFGIFYMVSYYGFNHDNNKNQTSLQSTGMALAIADYLKQHDELVPKNCKIILASFGSNECGAKGSAEFIKAHWGKDEELINPICFNIANINGKENKIINGEKKIKLKFDNNLEQIVNESFNEDDVNILTIQNRKNYTDSTSFAKNKFPTISLELKADMGNEEINYDNIFMATTNAVIKTLNYASNKSIFEKQKEQEKQEILKLDEDETEDDTTVLLSDDEQENFKDSNNY